VERSTTNTRAGNNYRFVYITRNDNINLVRYFQINKNSRCNFDALCNNTRNYRVSPWIRIRNACNELFSNSKLHHRYNSVAVYFQLWSTGNRPIIFVCKYKQTVVFRERFRVSSETRTNYYWLHGIATKQRRSILRKEKRTRKRADTISRFLLVFFHNACGKLLRKWKRVRARLPVANRGRARGKNKRGRRDGCDMASKPASETIEITKSGLGRKIRVRARSEYADAARLSLVSKIHSRGSVAYRTARLEYYVERNNNS